MLAAALRSLFAQKEEQALLPQWDQMIALTENFPTAAALMQQAREACWPATASQASTGARSGAITRWSNLTRRSSVAPRRRHLPQRRLHRSPGRRVVAGAAGGMAALWPPRILRALDGQTEQHQRSTPRSTSSCACSSDLITALLSGHGPDRTPRNANVSDTAAQ